MQNIGDLTVDQILCFLMAFIRIATMVAVFPVLGSRNAPVMVKAGLSLILAIILFPLIPTGVIELPTGLLSFSIVVAKEMLIGLILGYAGSLIFAVLNFAGRMLDQQMAFAMATMVDPVTDSPSTLIAQLNIILFSIIFLLIGGHHMFIEALAYSFTAINITNVHFAAGPTVAKLTQMTADIFVLGFRMASPVFVSLLITDISLGIIARTVPQMNVFIVGLPLKIGLGLVLLIICLPSFVNFFEGMVLQLKKDVYTLIQFMT
ncbi:MAG: flagellar biosynthetic protein FliR [Candidatus Raymondbacteria bacterium RifOxyA12_full_50_37]|uniref:Flagellar biosynthetic protein FliR n=1 Tax=Candidatus Raymondbacteria bacterium RIFOXYD12_FULL_49_13 TaxID=1817890 RepID=A0A1F7FAN4_UNCRA|nr:MAG: flagellar biosynthetic protein FliR [Candidatus Raymondbacteria bacterium RifOxyA12_full_50_37]OGJ92609.1 MAG: flagellar biosynthetic protein FliR [Candidatus Raymondbacteria bacterium RIFOXYA2_FULL_49_16]OGJ97963.1 MAG: flagellar biosynthetic protein FliR [Candidatus Raymondbacteria bacterium RIFOXYC2_FULL_50_21]OGJ98618.1 MAG: flagellar biosynthetic protein FliR [Candidatus Raymondbacteria bacterium RifOxyC12_full_50_8]OGK01989.1 MAG: flagellar biosynthetic protein FliR [Candidatus Ra